MKSKTSLALFASFHFFVAALSGCSAAPASENQQELVTQCPDQKGPAKKVCTGDFGCKCNGVFNATSKAACTAAPNCMWTMLNLSSVPDGLRQLASSQSAVLTPLCNTNPGCYESTAWTDPTPPADCSGTCCTVTYNRGCRVAPPPTDMPQPLDASRVPDLSQN